MDESLKYKQDLLVSLRIMHVHDGGLRGMKPGDCQLDTPNITISGEGNGVVEARP
jgi:hypothetical protein